MYFDSWQALWHMDGHGLYVWLAYTISFVVFAGLWVYPVVKRRKMLRAIALRKQHDVKPEEA